MRGAGALVAITVGVMLGIGACTAEGDVTIPPPAGGRDGGSGTDGGTSVTPQREGGVSTPPAPAPKPDAGTPPACAGAGTACLGPSGCRTGTIACSGTGGAPTCVESGDVPAGQSCPGGKVCSGAGACVACNAGGACTPTETCKTGAIACTTGAEVCTATGNVADGTSCGVDRVCSAGACVACAIGGACTPADPCHKGTIQSCATTPPTCVDTGALADNGTTCGTNQVCSGGACVGCTANLACAAANECHFGRTSCATGASVCDEQPKIVANGTPCGGASGRRCNEGTCACPAGTHDCGGTCVPNTSVATCGTSCTACPAPAGTTATCDGTSCGLTCQGTGEACVPANPCKTGTIQCTASGPSCVESGNVDAGAPCGGGQICDGAGACVACTPGTACTPAAPCKRGAIACTETGVVCNETGNLPDGSDCGAAMVCSGGACVACTPGGACTPTEPCHKGRLQSCAGKPDSCVDTGTNADDGAPCGAGGSGMVCTAGACGCPAGTHDCAGTCVSNTSVASCGTSCTPCVAPANAAATCDGTACGFSCGATACNVQRADSCLDTACQCGATPECNEGFTCVAGACQ